MDTPMECRIMDFEEKIERIGADRLCLVDDPYHLPETWELERIGKER